MSELKQRKKAVEGDRTAQPVILTDEDRSIGLTEEMIRKQRERNLYVECRLPVIIVSIAEEYFHAIDQGVPSTFGLRPTGSFCGTKPRLKPSSVRRIARRRNPRLALRSRLLRWYALQDPPLNFLGL